MIDTKNFNQISKGLLVMRLHFLVSTYLNLYVWDPVTQKVVIGNKIPESRSLSHKKSHLLTIDKLVAEMHVGDTFLE